MRLSDFDYALPDEAIARYPTERRDGARLLVLDRASGLVEHRNIVDLPSILRSGDLLVANDSKVLKARLYGKKADTKGRVEILLVEPVGAEDTVWRAMVNASKPVRAGAWLEVEGARPIQVMEAEGEGFVVLQTQELGFSALAEARGELPLPPYLGRRAEAEDEQRYQTVFSAGHRAGSVAAPTAGLHFSAELLAALTQQGIERTSLTLHVGPGTFLPVRVDDVSEHVMHAERFEISEGAAEQIRAAKARGGRVAAVGTTSTRVLESLDPPIRAATGSTDIFIQPGFTFRSVDVLLTNFHLPRSTLLMLVSAFAGRERVLAAYAEAIRMGYRFYSYGDAMLIT